jgi:hypothetical protein
MEQEKKVIGSFEKSGLEEVRVTLSTYRGTRYLDLRVFAKRASLEGEPAPTHKGITLKADLAGELRRLIDRSLAEFELERKVSGEVDEEEGSGEGSDEPGDEPA